MTSRRLPPATMAPTASSPLVMEFRATFGGEDPPRTPALETRSTQGRGRRSARADCGGTLGLCPATVLTPRGPTEHRHAISARSTQPRRDRTHLPHRVGRDRRASTTWTAALVADARHDVDRRARCARSRATSTAPTAARRVKRRLARHGLRSRLRAPSPRACSPPATPAPCGATLSDDHDAAARIAFETRSGNTATPDDGWSGYQSLWGQGGAINSPSARYIQYPRAAQHCRRARHAEPRARLDLVYDRRPQRPRTSSPAACAVRGTTAKVSFTTPRGARRRSVSSAALDGRNFAACTSPKAFAGISRPASTGSPCGRSIASATSGRW